MDMSSWYYVDRTETFSVLAANASVAAVLFQLGTETFSLLAVNASGSQKDCSRQVSLVTELGDSTVLLSRATWRVPFTPAKSCSPRCAVWWQEVLIKPQMVPFVLPVRFCAGFRPTSRCGFHCGPSFLRDVVFLHVPCVARLLIVPVAGSRHHQTVFLGISSSV